MTTQATEKITEILVSQFELSKEQIVPTADFSADLGFDSIEQVEFIMAIEETFGITVSDEDAEKIKTVQQAIDSIELTAK